VFRELLPIERIRFTLGKDAIHVFSRVDP
jgi:hypothetical protein